MVQAVLMVEVGLAIAGGSEERSRASHLSVCQALVNSPRKEH